MNTTAAEVEGKLGDAMVVVVDPDTGEELVFPTEDAYNQWALNPDGLTQPDSAIN